MDSMRTALFDYHKNKKSFWHPISLWNRNFAKKIKTGYAQISKDKPKYKFYYILQKEKTSPLVVILPSVGEGSSNSHGKILAELFYEEGYSAIILGSHFQWEFVKSIDDNYHVGLIKNDIKYINLLINNIISDLSKKHGSLKNAFEKTNAKAASRQYCAQADKILNYFNSLPVKTRTDEQKYLTAAKYFYYQAHRIDKSNTDALVGKARIALYENHLNAIKT